MDISVIIVNWNTRDLLLNCLRSLVSSSWGHTTEIIVVDNNSSDGSAEAAIAAFPGATVMNSGGNLGFAKANNLGLCRATAPLVLFLNPDTEVRKDTLQRMAEFMRANPKVGGLGCRIRGFSGEIKQLGLQWFPSPATEALKYLAVSDGTYTRLPAIFPYHDPQKSGEVSKLFGACLLVRRSVLDQVGSFDERFFMYCEDVDLCRRITDAGWRLYYLSDTEIVHLGGCSSSKAASHFAVLMNCESFSKLMRKYYGLIGSASYRLVAFLGAQARLALLCAFKLAAALGLSRSRSELSASISKYITITRWCLGLQKPVIRNS